MLKQRHFFNGALHILLGETENGDTGKIVINVNEITEGPNESGAFVDVIHIINDYYETIRVGMAVLPQTLTKDVEQLMKFLDVHYDDLDKYFHIDTLKDIIRTMVVNKNWHTSEDTMIKFFGNLINEETYESEDEYMKIIVFAPIYDDDNELLFNDSDEYHVYKNFVAAVNTEDNVDEEEMDEDQFYDDDDIEEEDEIVEEVVEEEEELEEELEEEHHHEYSQIFSKHFFN